MFFYIPFFGFIPRNLRSEFKHIEIFDNNQIQNLVPLFQNNIKIFLDPQLRTETQKNTIMSNDNNCPKCNSENTYQDVNLWICPDCFYEWDPSEMKRAKEEEEEARLVKDSNGNILKNGDSVSVIKDLKVKGSSSGLKSGTKVRNIHLVESSDGHNISCKIDEMGSIFLKSEFVRKVFQIFIQVFGSNATYKKPEISSYTVNGVI